MKNSVRILCLSARTAALTAVLLGSLAVIPEMPAVHAASSSSASQTVSGSASVSTGKEAWAGFPRVSPAALASVHLTYDLGGGRTYVLDKNDAPALLITNADGTPFMDPDTGSYIINPLAVQTLLKNLNPYVASSVPNGNAFLTTSGRLLTFTKIKTTGREVNYQAESNYLVTALCSGATAAHPLTTRDTYNIGDTYVEIDMTNQMLYYYQDGICALSTQIVTGNTSNGHATPQGVFKVLNKVRDTNLIGKDYVSHVDYWVPIIGNSIGIHDATWRSRFGGDIFETGGSHGCINVPLENMKILYPILTVGTPVVAFY